MTKLVGDFAEWYADQYVFSAAFLTKRALRRRIARQYQSREKQKDRPRKKVVRDALALPDPLTKPEDY
jgi:hypothetical protein